MSNTQQEIATPGCKKRISPLISVTVALIFVSFLAFGLIAFGLMLLTNNAVITVLVLIVLSVALAVGFVIVFKDERTVVKLVLDLVTAEIAVILIGWFISTLSASNVATNLIYIATTAVMAVILIAMNVIKVMGEKNTARSTRYLTYAATFVALGVIFKMLGNTVSSIVIIPNMRLSFVYIPWVLSGIVLGPVGGVLTALISDVLGQLTIAVGGAINPLTMLSNALFPLAPALIFKFIKKAPDAVKLFAGMFISLVICTMGIGSAALFWQYEYYNSMSFITYLITIRSPQMIIIAINFVLCVLLLPVVNRMMLVKRLDEGAQPTSN